MFRRISALLNLPAILEVKLAAIEDALADLDAGIAEVTEEIADLADQVEAGQLDQDAIAAELRDRAQRLRDIRPDTPVTEEPAPVEPEVPSNPEV